MSDIAFQVIAEKIHCTRVFKRGGKFVKTLEDGEAIVYRSGGEERTLPIPEHFQQTAEWEKGSIKHCQVAVWQGFYGEGDGKAAGADYIQALAKSQEANGANFLDVNVDEYSTDDEERCKLIAWTINIAQEASKVPISVDSSNMAILRAGLEACDRANGKPMINSVSLEREEGVALAGEFETAVVASAAGKESLPSDTEGRLANLAEIMPAVQNAGVALAAIHIDPLVFPVSTDSNNGKSFIESVKAIRETYGPDVHITGGLSNVSFGMPNRKLINQVFTALAVDDGVDSGIVDPGQINADILASLDRETEGFKLAAALVRGEDEFGMDFITACRAGTV